MSRLLVIQIAGLGYDFLARHGMSSFEGLVFRPMESSFPAVTCTAQAVFRTATPPTSNGMVGNGFMHDELQRPLFWDQSARWVQGPRVWDAWRRKGHTAGLLFWQQSLGESADLILSPAPIHKHHGGMIESFYSRPAGLYDRLARAVGSAFKLARYWGPLASARSSEWIASATAALLRLPEAPELLFTYLPALDYDLQRYGPASDRAGRAFDSLLDQILTIVSSARSAGYDLLLFGDYAIAAADRGAVFPNLALREAGLLSVRRVRGMAYPDFYASRAFAVADHEIAHVYVRGRGDDSTARRALENLDGVDRVMGPAEQKQAGLAHPRAGTFVAVAKEGRWLAYPWWSAAAEAPEFAARVDIHAKPGYDPCELFFGWPPFSISRNTSRIRGSHGRTGPGREVCWASTCVFDPGVATLADLAARAKNWLEDHA
ncbi:MAG: alkaline phosphatase family protein [Verrucomicrobiota bacterium]|nr:alkaline phosphatase family protein [Verrucomicrobiota bacterium]